MSPQNEGRLLARLLNARQMKVANKTSIVDHTHALDDLDGQIERGQAHTKLGRGLHRFGHDADQFAH